MFFCTSSMVALPFFYTSGISSSWRLKDLVLSCVEAGLLDFFEIGFKEEWLCATDLFHYPVKCWRGFLLLEGIKCEIYAKTGLNVFSYQNIQD